MRAWCLLLGALMLAAGLVAWREQPPAPRQASAPPTAFSAARAWPVLAFLADTIGLRIAGTPAAGRALAHIDSLLRAIPGLEVEIQDVSGAFPRGARVDLYRTRNVVARLPGRLPDAVLVSAHYDSPASSVGAADDALAVAAIVELLRALAARGDTLRNTVVANINGAEEQGLLGAHGFLRHRWMRDVRVAVDLESAGPGGKALLFQTGPGNAWLAEVYAGGVSHPYGTVLGQDIFQSGLIPSATDFEVYVAAGIPGLDIAIYRDGYAYHTALDQTARIDSGTLQHMGATALDAVAALASTDLRRPADSTRAVYYDLLGATMFAYGHRTAAVLALIATALVVLVLVLAVRAGSVSAGDLGWGTLAALGGATLALVLTPVFALLPYWTAGRAHGWYAHPWRAYLSFASIAAAIMLAAWWLLNRRAAARGRTPARRATGTLAGVLAGTTALLLLLTALGVGSAYLLLWMTIGGAFAMLALSVLRGTTAWWAAGACLVLPLLLTLQAGSLAAEFATIGGRTQIALPYDVVIGALAATVTVVVFPVPAALAAAGGRHGRASLAAAAVAIAGLIATAMTFPYTADRPQRLAIVHADSTLSLRGFDFLDEGYSWRRIAAASERDVSPDSIPAALVPLAEPGYVIRELARTDSTRELELRITAPPEADALVLAIPRAALAGWEYGELPRRGERVTVRVVDPPDTGVVVRLVTRGDFALGTLAAVRAADSEETRRLKSRLPEWTDAYSILQRRKGVTLWLSPPLTADPAARPSSPAR